MFDAQDKLKVPIHLQTAQALALIQAYLIYESGRMEGEFKFFSKSQRFRKLHSDSVTKNFLKS